VSALDTIAGFAARHRDSLREALLMYAVVVSTAGLALSLAQAPVAASEYNIVVQAGAGLVAAYLISGVLMALASDGAEAEVGA
jgi:hypothetical protein